MARFRTLCILSCISLLISVSAAHAQQSPAMQAAGELFNQSKWPEAAKAYTDITAKDPRNGAAWTNLGESLLQQHKPEAAVDAFQHAVKAGFRPALNQVNIARA